MQLRRQKFFLMVARSSSKLWQQSKLVALLRMIYLMMYLFIAQICLLKLSIIFKPIKIRSAQSCWKLEQTNKSRKCLIHKLFMCLIYSFIAIIIIGGMDAEISPEVKAIAEEFKVKGNDCFKDKRYEKAYELYSKAIDLNPHEHSYYSNRSICAYNLARFSESLQDAIKSAEVNPKFSKAWRRKGLAQIQLMKLPQSIQSFRTALQLEATQNAAITKELSDAQYLLKMWQKYQECKDCDERLKLLDFILKSVKGDQSLKLLRVEELSKCGQSSDALTLLSSLSLSNTQKKDYWYLRGVIEINKCNLQKSKKLFTQAAKYGENQRCQILIDRYVKSEQLKEEGNTLIQQNQYNSAVEKYSEALKADPQNRRHQSIIYSNRALALMKLGDYEKALADLNFSIKYNPEYLKSIGRRAQVFQKLHRYEQACSDYQLMKKIDPTIDIAEKVFQARKKIKKKPKSNYYDVLGVNKHATSQQIRAKYRKIYKQMEISRQNKPSSQKLQKIDKQIKQLTEAYSVLSDPSKRQLYDSGEMLYPSEQTMDPTEIFKMFFQNQNQKKEKSFASPFDKTTNQSNYYGFN